MAEKHRASLELADPLATRSHLAWNNQSQLADGHLGSRQLESIADYNHHHHRSVAFITPPLSSLWHP